MLVELCILFRTNVGKMMRENVRQIIFVNHIILHVGLLFLKLEVVHKNKSF